MLTPLEEQLLEACSAMLNEYEGVCDMAVPHPHQSTNAKLAENLALTAIEAAESKRADHSNGRRR